MLTRTRTLPTSASQSLVKALLSQLPQDSSSAIITVKSDSNPPATPNGTKTVIDGPIYDPAAIYLLELATVLSLRDDDSVAALGSSVAEALQNVIRDAANYHATTVSRVTYYLLSLLNAGYVSIHEYKATYLLTFTGSFIS
jgi:brefeldin A-resistance guanine nucleotide exchange factor 1